MPLQLVMRIRQPLRFLRCRSTIWKPKERHIVDVQERVLSMIGQLEARYRSAGALTWADVTIQLEPT